jgi:L-ascorbate metabolism protein UlaG (beta-lactamase superfamily)
VFETDTFQTARGDLTITFIGHGTLMFQWAGQTIHIDPWTNLADYSHLPGADVILVTHEHRDHLDTKAIDAIRRQTTTVLVPASCAESVPDSTVMKNGDKQTIFEGFTVQAVGAYNIVHKRPNGQPYHPKGRGNGYVLTLANTCVYVAGDTENVPEMADLKNIAIAFLPMNLPYTMTPEMAADAAQSFKPKILYPYHYGDTDISQLKERLENETDIELRIRKMQ